MLHGQLMSDGWEPFRRFRNISLLRGQVRIAQKPPDRTLVGQLSQPTSGVLTEADRRRLFFTRGPPGIQAITINQAFSSYGEVQLGPGDLRRTVPPAALAAQSHANALAIWPLSSGPQKLKVPPADRGDQSVPGAGAEHHEGLRIRAVQEAAGRRQCHVHLAGIYAASGAAASSCSYRRYSLCTCSREIGCAYYVASRHAVTQMQVVCCGVVSDVGTRKPSRAMVLCYQHRAAQRCPRQGRGAGGGAEDGGVVGGPGAPHAEAQVPGGQLCARRPPPAGGAPWPGARGGPPPAPRASPPAQPQHQHCHHARHIYSTSIACDPCATICAQDSCP